MLKLFSITTTRIKRHVTNPEDLKTFDYYCIKAVEQGTSVLLLSSIYDFTLYCTHQLLHQDRAIT